MGFGKKIIDFIAPPIKQKVPKQDSQNHTQQEIPKKKPKIGAQEEIQEIEYELLESTMATSTENNTEIRELETEEYVAQTDTHTPTQKETAEYTVEALSYQEYEAITQDFENSVHADKNDLDTEIENITAHYSIADIPVKEQETNPIEHNPDIYASHLPNTSFLQDEPRYFIPFYTQNNLFENAHLTYLENDNALIHNSQNEQKYTFTPLEKLFENKSPQQIDIENFTATQDLNTEKFIFSDNKKSITLPIHRSMQTELSNPIDYQPTDIQKITESISLEAPAMNALLKNAVRTIMQRKGIQEITPETLPLIKEDLSLVLEASGSNLSTMVADVLRIKKIVNDKVNERRDKINEYKNELTQKISQLLSQVRHLEAEVGKLDNIIYTDIEELTKINKTLDTYQMLLTSISEQKFNFE